MKKAIAMLLMSASVSAQNNSSLNLQLPYGFQNYNSDKFRAGELDCSNAIGGGVNLEFGVTGIINGSPNIPQSTVINPGASRDVGVYARIILPLDPVPERINCNSLYQLELRKKRAEIEKLEAELENLRKLKTGKFEN